VIAEKISAVRRARAAGRRRFCFLLSTSAAPRCHIRAGDLGIRKRRSWIEDRAGGRMTTAEKNGGRGEGAPCRLEGARNRTAASPVLFTSGKFPPPRGCCRNVGNAAFLVDPNPH